MNKREKEENVSLSDKINMLGVYMEEWKYRDQTLLSTLYKTSFIAFVIMVLPYITEYWSIKKTLPFAERFFPFFWRGYGFDFCTSIFRKFESTYKDI